MTDKKFRGQGVAKAVEQRHPAGEEVTLMVLNLAK
ncbi:hypothetical protein QE436_000478 [Pantoea anthophila]|nr:hypothetical protein [Pantoea anthophila]